jgi:hypothetical protein
MAATLTREEFADMIEYHATLFVAALRDGTSSTALVEYNAAGAPQLATQPAAPVVIAAQQPSAPVLWAKVGELPNQAYRWPRRTEHYNPFEVWQADRQIGLGKADNSGHYYGKEHRGYWLAFEMVNGQKRRPIVVFNEADDYESSGDLVAIIKGKGDGGRSMFKPGDDLPPGYENFEIDVFRNRITGPQAFNRLAVVARGGDRQAMCTHALLQLALRP